MTRPPCYRGATDRWETSSPLQIPEMWETNLLLVAGWLQSFLVTTAQVNSVKKKQSDVSANLNPHTCKTHPIISPGFGTNWVWSSGGRDRLRPPNRVSHKQSALLCVLLPSPIQYIRWWKKTISFNTLSSITQRTQVLLQMCLCRKLSTSNKQILVREHFLLRPGTNQSAQKEWAKINC